MAPPEQQRPGAGSLSGVRGIETQVVDSCVLLLRAGRYDMVREGVELLYELAQAHQKEPGDPSRTSVVSRLMTFQRLVLQALATVQT